VSVAVAAAASGGRPYCPGVDTELVDPARLARWMDEQALAGAGEIPVVSRLTGGSQNELFAVERGGEQLVLRRPPSLAAEGRYEAFSREHRVLAALRDTDVPHPRLHGVCDDVDVLGGPFYLTERVEGWSPMQLGGWAPPFDTDLDARAGLAVELVDGIARLARVDWRAVGLEGFGRPDGFHDRQVDRWLAFLERVKTRELPGVDVAADWLRRHRPKVYEPGILHGDYQFANVMFRHGAPARLAAIVDWEMSTIGDPLLDLGWALISYPADDRPLAGAMSYVDHTGMPPRADLLAHYEKVSGRSTEDLPYFLILARFKLGIVLEQSVARLARGEADERVSSFAETVLGLIKGAAELAEATP
jgi:aminoglycoside phosphotransferase (APT) family kinase protein